LKSWLWHACGLEKICRGWQTDPFSKIHYRLALITLLTRYHHVLPTDNPRRISICQNLACSASTPSLCPLDKLDILFVFSDKPFELRDLPIQQLIVQFLLGLPQTCKLRLDDREPLSRTLGSLWVRRILFILRLYTMSLASLLPALVRC
jgi:hypothetical protein